MRGEWVCLPEALSRGAREGREWREWGEQRGTDGGESLRDGPGPRKSQGAVLIEIRQ